MARIAGINIPQNKLVHVGLTYIYGIGQKFSYEICKSLAIPKDKRVNQLTDQWHKWKAYGKLSEPIELIEYRKNPPAYECIGRVRFK